MQEVKEMKKTISIFLMLCLLLPGIALAEVQSQVNTPAEYKGTHNSPSGKSHIYVDAQVENDPDLPGICPRAR